MVKGILNSAPPNIVLLLVTSSKILAITNYMHFFKNFTPRYFEDIHLEIPKKPCAMRLHTITICINMHSLTDGIGFANKFTVTGYSRFLLIVIQIKISICR